MNDANEVSSGIIKCYCIVSYIFRIVFILLRFEYAVFEPPFF